jgi:hypothetical protein
MGRRTQLVGGHAAGNDEVSHAYLLPSIRLAMCHQWKRTRAYILRSTHNLTTRNVCAIIICCSGPVRKISPKYNQAALFRTSDISWHGMPDPVKPLVSPHVPWPVFVVAQLAHCCMPDLVTPRYFFVCVCFTFCGRHDWTFAGRSCALRIQHARALPYIMYLIHGRKHRRATRQRTKRGLQTPFVKMQV